MDWIRRCEIVAGLFLLATGPRFQYTRRTCSVRGDTREYRRCFRQQFGSVHGATSWNVPLCLRGDQGRQQQSEYVRLSQSERRVHRYGSRDSARRVPDIIAEFRFELERR